MQENTANVLHSTALTSMSGYCLGELKHVPVIQKWCITVFSRVLEENYNIMELKPIVELHAFYVSC